MSDRTIFYNIPLTCLGRRIIAATLGKMTACEGIRMRRTCRFINKLVDDANISFPSDFVLSISYDKKYKNNEIQEYNIYKSRYQFMGVNIDVFGKISNLQHARCIRFDILFMCCPFRAWPEFHIFCDRADIYENELRTLRMRCQRLWISDIPFEIMEKFIKTVSFVEFRRSFVNDHYLTPFEMKQLTHCNYVSVEHEYISEKDMKRMMSFRYVDLRSKSEYNGLLFDVLSLLLSISLDSPSFRMERLAVERLPSGYISEIENWPNVKVIWKNPMYNNHISQCKEKAAILIMDTPSKLAIIKRGESRHFCAFMRHEVFFVDKRNPQCLSSLILDHLIPLMFPSIPMDLSSISHILQSVRIESFEEDLSAIADFSLSIVHYYRSRFSSNKERRLSL